MVQSLLQAGSAGSQGGALVHPALLLLFIPAGVMLGLFLVSRFSGWASLGEKFRLSRPFVSRARSFQSAQLRGWAGYNNCLTIGADAEGLYLRVMFFGANVFHPALFIPWPDVTVQRKQLLWWNYVEFRLGRELSVPFRISERLARELKDAAGNSWPVEAI